MGANEARPRNAPCLRRTLARCSLTAHGKWPGCPSAQRACRPAACCPPSSTRPPPPQPSPRPWRRPAGWPGSCTAPAARSSRACPSRHTRSGGCHLRAVALGIERHRHVLPVSLVIERQAPISCACVATGSAGSSAGEGAFGPAFASGSRKRRASLRPSPPRRTQTSFGYFPASRACSNTGRGAPHERSPLPS